MAKIKGYKYAGLQFKGECFASNTYGRYGSRRPDTECNMQCKRDEKGKMCGASWRNSVFDLSKVKVSLEEK